MLAETAVGQGKCSLALRFGLRLDQVRKALRLRQVYPAIFERAAGELTRLCTAKALDPTQCCEQRVDYSAATMALKFNRIFARRARWRVEPQHQRLVDQFAGNRMAQLADRRNSRFG